MAKTKKEERDSEGFIQLKVIPGGPFDQFRKRAIRLPKNVNKAIDLFTDEYGMDAIVNMTEVDIGDYVYQKGINHSLNMNVGRNIPWIEDGLKSVERRILYSMYQTKIYNGKFEKVAGISGELIKNYHPHGEMSVNDTIYRLGRARSIMIPYIRNSGNFGNMEDMRPAAPRYASASLSAYAMDCFFSEMGAKYPIFDTKDNYKYSDVEPVFLTSRYPNILMQWNQGIGKGAASWLGAFNSKELLKVAIKMLDEPDCKVDIYPDTPVPIDIINKSELKGCFDKPEFKVRMRAQYKVVADKKRDNNNRIVDKFTIVFTSLPLAVTGDAVRREIIAIKEDDQKKSSDKKKLPEVLGIEIDASDETPGGIEFIVEYEKGYDPDALAEKLFKSTSLGKTVGVRYVLITDNKPEFFTPRQVLQTWISQRYDQKRRYYHQMAIKCAKDRAQLEALCVILESSANIDKAVEIAKTSKTRKDTIEKLMKAFGFTEFQAACVLEIKLSNLPKMDVDETRRKRDQALADYKHYRKILADENAIKDAIRDELETGLKKYGKDRLANVFTLKAGTAENPETEKVVLYSRDHYYAVDDEKDLVKLKDRVGHEYKMVKFSNMDTVLVVNRAGNVKLLDGFAFSTRDGGISTAQLGIPDVIRIVPLTKDLKGLLLMSSSGFGKVIDLVDVVKSTKSKITVLSQGDFLAGAIPITSKMNRNDAGRLTGTILAVAGGTQVYWAPAEEFPILKRTAAGNRIMKMENGTFTDLYYLESNTEQTLIYSEYGYLKIVDTSALKFNKRKPKSIDMGKDVMGIVPLAAEGSTKTKLYDTVDGVIGITITTGKMVHLTTSTGEELKFRLGSSIGSPVKVLKKGRDEFYHFVSA